MLATAHVASGKGSILLGIATEPLHKPVPAGGDPVAAAAAKSVRFVLQREAQTLLYDPEAGPHGQHRTTWCHRAVMGDTVSVQRKADGGVRVAGVMMCNQPWTCPVCCIRVAQPRAADLKRAVETWVKAAPGNLVYLVTYTFPHEGDELLADLVAKFTDARQRFANCRTFKRIRADHESPGVVRSTEVTVGRRNGWHPHLHELMFVRGALTVEECDQLRSDWIRILLKVGLGDQSRISDMWDRALDIRGGEGAAEYIAKFGREEKWGVSAELTRRHAKSGTSSPTAETYKPFALLSLSAGGDEWAGARFREYSVVFKGKRMLTWSPGLRARLDMPDEVDDDQLPPEEGYGDCVQIVRADWQVLLSRRAVQFVIEITALQGADPLAAQQLVDDLIAQCRRTPATASGIVRVRGLFGFGEINNPVTWQ